MSITASEGTITATLDGTTTITGQDSTYTSGFFGIIPWDGNFGKFNVCLDDISVKTNLPNMVYDSNLKLGNATLNGKFNPGYTSYQASIDKIDNPVTLIKPSSDNGATFSILLNGTDMTSDFDDTETVQTLPLVFGPNTLTIVQTSSVGATTNYTVGIYKPYTTATIETVSSVSALVGTPPTLPTTVVVAFDGGDPQQIPVKWDMLNNHVLNTPGTYTVTGSLEGMYEKVSITVYINGITSIDSLSPISTGIEEAPVLPTSISAQMIENGQPGSTTLPITFVDLDPSLYSKAATIIAVAYVDGRSATILQHVVVSETEAQDKTLVSITTPAPITGVESGTAKTAEALGLPASVELVTDAGRVVASVTWG
ncbi:MAG TPA: hypothetical protein DEA91_23125, partial [Paenibacillus sp.]|nr:hypothetical protein [Paenibacillus sp.]